MRNGLLKSQVTGAAPPADEFPTPEGKASQISLLRKLTKYLSLPSCLNAFVLLNVPEILAESGGSPLSADEIVSKFPKKHSSSAFNLNRILRNLAVHGFLKEHVEEEASGFVYRYELDGLGKLFADQEEGSFASTYLLIQTEGAAVKAWSNLHEAVLQREVSVFKKANGASMYEWMSKPEGTSYAKVFNTAMEQHSLGSMQVLLKVYTRGFAAMSSIVDVGGGYGTCMGMLVKEFPNIRAINFDLPHVIASAPAIPGVEHVGGDYMSGNVPSGEIIFLKHILHNWDDENCVKILKTCYNAIPKSGKVMIAELLMPTSVTDDPLTREAIFMDLAMIATTEKGRERTEQQYKDLIIAAGFSKFEVAVDVREYFIQIALMEVTK